MLPLAVGAVHQLSNRRGVCRSTTVYMYLIALSTALCGHHLSAILVVSSVQWAQSFSKYKSITLCGQNRWGRDQDAGSPRRCTLPALCINKGVRAVLASCIAPL